MGYELKSARYLAADVLARALRPGDRAVDATMGNGHDTAFLCELVGESGHVYAFDVQRDAVANTRERLSQTGLLGRASLFCLGHERMAEQVTSPVAAVVFNLGWLPGGDHSITTEAGATIEGLRAALKAIRTGGIVTVVLYDGHEEGRREKERVLRWAEKLDTKRLDMYAEIDRRHTWALHFFDSNRGPFPAAC